MQDLPHDPLDGPTERLGSIRKARTLDEVNPEDIVLNVDVEVVEDSVFEQE